MIKKLMYKGNFVVVFIFLLLTSCGVSRQRTTIPDYLILSDGKEVLDSKPLDAFVFENKQNKISFLYFVSNKYNLGSLLEREFWVTIGGEKYKILIYDNSEFEKYFHVTDFIVTDLNPTNIDSENPKFIAISMISSRNEDCISEKSLLHNIAINYLKDLKDEFYKQ